MNGRKKSSLLILPRVRHPPTNAGTLNWEKEKSLEDWYIVQRLLP